jgi:transposase
MNFISGWHREQRHFLPECLEDYVAPGNPVRFLDAFVDSLDLHEAKFVFPKDNSQSRGRPGYHPRVMLKLYLYGYLRQLRSSRRLEQEAQRNLELIWLLGKLTPDFKTIADFRRDNSDAFKAVLRQFNRLCRELDLFGGELIAIDGTKVKGQNAPGKNWSATKLEKQMKRLDEHLEEYLQALDQGDEQPQNKAHPLSAEELQGKIQEIQQKKEQAAKKLQQIQAAGETQLSATDPDSRSMKTAQGYVVGYNVQGAADAKHHLLVVSEVINIGADQGQLAVMAQAAKAELEITQADIVADGGYHVGPDVKSCQEMGLEPYVPEVNNSPSERAGLYGKKDFTYDAVADSYRCPAGQTLSKRREVEDKGRRIWNYDNPGACGSCPLKGRCTEAKYRTVGRWEHEACVERMAAQVAAAPEKLAQRKTIIEHCWGTLKWLLPGGFLVKGLKKVGGEVSLAHFAYNFKRALQVVGLTKLLEALRKGPAKRSPEGPAGSQPGMGRALACA